jgi:glutathione S-transferase
MGIIKFYTNPMSRGQIARWMLEEVGVPYEQVLLDYGTGMKDASYLAINPMGKVPAIQHDGKVVTECAAICAYLADAFPEAGLAPVLANRADYYRWLFFAAGPVETAVTARAFGLEAPADKARSVGYGSFEATIDTLADAVSGRSFVAGDQFSAADVYVGAQIDWGLQFGTIPTRPEFETYVAGLRARPAYIRAKMIDAELIAAAKAAGS